MNAVQWWSYLGWCAGLPEFKLSQYTNVCMMLKEMILDTYAPIPLAVCQPVGTLEDQTKLQ